MIKKKNFLSILLNMEIISVVILLIIYLNYERKIQFFFFIVFIIREALIGLVLCIKFVYFYNNVKIKHINLTKF